MLIQILGALYPRSRHQCHIGKLFLSHCCNRALKYQMKHHQTSNPICGVHGQYSARIESARAAKKLNSKHVYLHCVFFTRSFWEGENLDNRDGVESIVSMLGIFRYVQMFAKVTYLQAALYHGMTCDIFLAKLCMVAI